MSNKETPIVPPQQEGNSSDTDAKATFDSTEAAGKFYQIAKQRLLEVNDWQKWAGAATAQFQLMDEKGNHVNRPVQQGDYFKIDIPGPGPVTGDGFDWVRVETINEINSGDGAQVAIQVRPASNPNN